MESNFRESWIEAQLEDILISLESGSRPKGGVRGITSGIPSIGGEHLNDSGSFDFSNIKFVPEKFASNMNRGQIEHGDVLIVKDGATTGKTSIVTDAFPFKRAVINEHVFICRPSSLISSKYLFYFLWSKEGKDRILENFKGSAQGGINTGFASNTTVPLAPLPEQHRIVAKLDALFEKIESNKQRLEKIPKILKRFRQSVLAAAVSGELTEEWREKNGIVEEWEEKSLRELTEKFTYGSSQKSETTGKVPVLRMGNIQDGKIVWNDLKYSSDENEIKKYKLVDGDVLFNRTNSPELVGKTAIYRNERPAIYAGYLIKIKTGKNLNPEFLNLCLNTIQAKEWCNEVKSDGVSQSNINAQKLGDFLIQTPPIDEQTEIVKRVEQLFAFANRIESRYTKAKVMLDKLPQSILAKAFRGELVAQNPEDEPASVLLERIKEEKEKLLGSLKEGKRKKAKEYSLEERPLKMVAEKKTKYKKAKARK